MFREDNHIMSNGARRQTDRHGWLCVGNVQQEFCSLSNDERDNEVNISLECISLWNAMFISNICYVLEAWWVGNKKFPKELWQGKVT